MRDFWEPWVPEVGQRVRLRANGECPYRKVSMVFDGAEGTVVEVIPNEQVSAPGHRFLVVLDGGKGVRSAAAELEPAL